jgi:hypothetical protein
MKVGLSYFQLEKLEENDVTVLDGDITPGSSPDLENSKRTDSHVMNAICRMTEEIPPLLGWPK